MIETTGLANPGPVAQTFFVDEEVGVHYLLDAVVTVVDARHAMDQLDAHEEAQRQVGFADKILISKTDLVDAEQLAALTARLKRINPRAPIGQSDFGKAPLAEVLDLHGFNLNDKLEIDPGLPAADEADEHVHGPDCDHVPRPCDHHATITTTATTATTSPPSSSKASAPSIPSAWTISWAAWCNVFGPRMLRYKGVLLMDGRRPQGGVPGRAPDHGQRPGRKMGRRRGTWQQNGFYWQKFTKRCVYPRFGAMFGINYPGFTTRRDQQRVCRTGLRLGGAATAAASAPSRSSDGAAELADK